MKRNTRRIIATGSIAAVAAGSMLFLSSAQAAKSVTPVKQARATVLTAVPGKVLSIKKKTRSGFTAWAITVKRSDGSVVVGYVDVKSGIAFDWTVKAAPGEPTIDLDGSDSVLAPAEPPEPVPTPTPTATATPTPSPSPTTAAAAVPAAAPAAAPAARPTADTERRPSGSASPTASARVPGGNRGDGSGFGRPSRDDGRRVPATPAPTTPAPATPAPSSPAPTASAPSTPAPTPTATAPESVAPAAAPAPAPQQVQQQRPQGGDGGGRGGGGGRRSFTPPAG